MVEADIRRRARAPAPALDFLVVLDFEWTADRGRPMRPIAEITQFPSVLVKLDYNGGGGADGGGADGGCAVVDEFNAYVRPTLNPTLTPFSIEARIIDRWSARARRP